MEHFLKIVQIGEIYLRDWLYVNPKVSVIIPVYNCEKYIEECVMSVLRQTYDNVEIVVVNDGSADKSDEIIKAIAAHNPQILYFYKKNEGVAIARNYAIENATGDYLLFVDSDDYIESNYVESLVKYAVKNDSDMVISGYTMLYQKDSALKRTIPGIYKKNEKEEWAYRISSTMAHLYNKEFWDKNKLCFVSEKNARAEDVPVVLFANVMAKNICICTSTGYIYRQHEQSAMNKKSKKVKFLFPYNSFKDMYNRIKSGRTVNSKAFFNFGVLKFLAHFDTVMYRKADRSEKIRFSKYVCELLKEDFKDMTEDWKNIRNNIELPLTHRIAIELFIMKLKTKKLK